MLKLAQPTYTLKLPSTKKTIKYRPFVVKEEKALLLAIQEENSRGIIENIKNLVKVCTFEEVDPEKIPYYDLEYIFLMIRAKSVSEEVDLIGTCDCGTKNDFVVNLEQAKVEGMDKPPKIKIDNSEYYIEMSHPSINYFINDEKESNENEESAAADDTYYTAAAAAIKTIYTEEDVFEDLSLKEKIEFLDNLTSKQQKPIADFIKTMPKLVVKGQYDCVKCGKHHDIDVSGIERFFI